MELSRICSVLMETMWIAWLAEFREGRSIFPESSLVFDPEAQIMVIDYELPNLDAPPKYREVKYVASRSELQYVQQ